MKSISVIAMLSLLLSGETFAQLTEDFSDGDFTASPSWSGTAEDFRVNTNLSLQLNAATASTSWLSVPFSASSSKNIEWELLVKQSFAPSGANFGRVYLMSDHADLTESLNGYYLQFGETGSQDAVELFRQSGTVRTSVCRATNGAIASAFELRLHVTRTTGGDWHLSIDYTGGTDYVSEASGTDITHETTSYFGILCTFTVSNTTAFSYDDVVIRTTQAPDTSPPHLLAVETVDAHSLRLLFSESLSAPVAEDPQHYAGFPTPGHPSSCTLLPDQRTVLLSFAEAFNNGYESFISVQGLADLAGNVLSVEEDRFLYFSPSPLHFRDVIISEIFADPAPQVGLPAAEFVELFNRSENVINLDAWTISDGASTGIFPSHFLMPGQYVIVCSSTNASLYDADGGIAPLSNLPTLNNAGDVLRLVDSAGMPVDTLRYSAKWYGDEDKAEGGWSLERIDPESLCMGASNWSASVDPSGGTPGKQNSVWKNAPDFTGPVLMNATQVADSVVRIELDEAVQPVLAEGFLIDPPLGLKELTFVDDSQAVLDLHLASPPDTTIVYRFTAVDLRDCKGNLVAETQNAVYLNEDVTPPTVVRVEAISPTTVIVTYSEPVAPGAAEQVTNYDIAEWGHPLSARLGEDATSVTLSFALPFTNGGIRSLRVEGTQDRAGNAMVPGEFSFLYFEPSPVYFKDVIITEILADPTPSRGLPEAEFVEILNRSDNPVDLSGWTFSDEARTSILKSYILLPHEYLILTSVSSEERLSRWGPVLAGEDFPSINNGGELLSLRTPDDVAMDSVRFSAEWYRDDEKKDGGWSLEIIDPENVCEEGTNWFAAEADDGGTPGKENSVFDRRPDTRGPALLAVVPLSPNRLLVTFSEKLGGLPPVSGFTTQPPITIETATFSDRTLTGVYLDLAGSLKPGTRYEFQVEGVSDCPGNSIAPEFSAASFVLPERAAPGDIVVNEILFNPTPTGVDFVEVFNVSEKTIDLKNWRLGNALGAGSPDVAILNGNLLLSPGEYKAFTADPNILKGEYLLGREENFVRSTMPAFNDREGTVVLRDDEGTIMDSVYYTEGMHSPFLKDTEGVSLERISWRQSAIEAQNWRSASSESGFATPGYANSNMRPGNPMVPTGEDAVIVDPEVIARGVPSQPFAQIRYHFRRGGFVANVRIIDSAGRTIKELAGNELLGTEGFFRWDGDVQDGSPARTGYYMVWFEVFDETGMLATFRERVAVL